MLRVGVVRQDPGDGSDTVDGQAGFDMMQFNGSAGNEAFDLSSVAGRLRFARDVGSVVVETDDLEQVNLSAFAGTDRVTVNDLSGTDVTKLFIDLAAPGTPAGDTQADSVTIVGTAGNDTVNITSAGLSYAVTGLPVAVTVAGSEGANDSLVLNTLGGNDVVNASTLPAGIVKLTIDGGAENDTLTGSQGGDVLRGGDGSDVIIGGFGNDSAAMGDGNDTFVWNSGDGSDVVEGEGGFDTMAFNGADAAETFDLSANGARLRLSRDLGAVVMDTAGLEQVNLATLGGADTVSVNDLSGVGVTTVNLNLAAAAGGGDGQADKVIVAGTNGNDNVVVNTSASLSGRVGGLAATINLFALDAAFDELVINAFNGEDTVDASSVTAGLPRLTINGGNGNDLIKGGAGADVVNGGTGADTVFLGGGDDTFIWNPGDASDLVEGQAGVDAMIFNGANIAENIEVSANGGRLRVTRNIGAVIMDVNDVERVDVNAVGGADHITVNDLTGTDVTQVNVNLGATGGGGDLLADNVIINGTTLADTMVVSGNAAGISVFGLAAQVNIVGAEAANDRLTIRTLAGDDAVEASGLAADATALTVDGGEDADVLVGGSGNDTLLGGLGDDVLIGGPGLDVLDGGLGDSVVIQ